MRSSARPTSSSVEIFPGGLAPGDAGGARRTTGAAGLGAEMPDTMAMPPAPSRQTVSSLLVPFSSFSIDELQAAW